MSKPLHHLIRKVIHPTVPGLLLPELILFNRRGEGTTYEPLVDFTVSRSAMSITSHLKPVRVMGFLWDALVENQGKPGRDARKIGRRRFLENFVTNLARGTIVWNDGELRDDTGLYWRPPSPDVLNGFACGFDAFVNYMSDPEDRPESDPFTEMCDGLFDLKILMSSSGRPVKGLGLLAHLKKNERTPTQPGLLDNVVEKSGRRSYLEAPTKEFSRVLLPTFLTEDFRTYSGRGIDASGRCFARLLCLGVRSSEALLMWEDDIKIRNGKVEVFLRHPGKFRDRSRGNRTREEVLLEDYDMLPRTKMADKCKVGWKDPALKVSLSNRLSWLDGTEEGAFLVIADYILNVRNPIMQARRAKGLRDHPYLLVTTRSGKDFMAGDPWTDAASISSFKRAVKRMAKRLPDEGIEYGKYHGTTRHAFRHSYGQDAEESGLDDKSIMRKMNHKSIFSSRVYRNKSEEDVHRQFEEANARRRSTTEPQIRSTIPSAPMSESLDDFYRTIMGARWR
ncbi:tyrosine-type recombinase/integrase [Rhizobium leguminosarum]|uniref:Tyrosine-type recombinase/integrase n=1 Tax=Rhizobium ruizarguesonis TaxID=2081791 RepID=A0AAE4YTQ2_9HYPH|nr:tyrosine-type recombinase/integrase [Rhizobium ruizarguesonis]NEI50524.1 tyrosine-type recombinase/integrase [Rhizobium ruizarguesonis]